MRVSFLGSPPFGTPVLEALLSSRHEVALVVTQPERAAGRGRKPRPSPIAELARERGIPLLRPSTTRDPEFVRALADSRPDALLVASFGEILRRDVLDVPRLGPFNVHASLLPRHRGASPIQAAILAGDPVTGVSVQRIVPALDEGDVVHALETPIGPEETAGELAARLAVLGGRAAVEALDRIEAGTAEFRPQDPALATYAPKLRKEDGRVDFARPAAELHRFVRAMTPWPGARTSDPAGRELILLAVRPLDEPAGAPPGTLLPAGRRLVVATADRALEVLRLKPAGKREMDGEEWLRGARLEAGERLGSA